MKKLYSLITAVMLGGAISSAQVTIGETNYATLDAAVAAAAEGDVLTINEDITISAMISLTGINNLTIQGAEGKNITITCRAKNHHAFRVQKTATLKNLNLVYSDDQSNAVLIETSQAAGNLTMENVNISDFSTTQAQGVLSFKGSGKGTLTNVTFTNNTVPAARGEIFIGSNGSTIKGTTNGSIYIQKNLSITATDYAPAAPVKIYLEDGFTANRNLILGTADVNNFELQSTTFILQANGNNIQVVNKPEPNVVIGETSYTTLYDAIAAAQEGDVIEILKDITIGERVNLNGNVAENLTIEAADGVTISCSNKGAIAFLVNKTVTFKNLNLVYTGNGASNRALVEVSNAAGKLTADNCTISNFNTNQGQGVFSIKNSGAATLNNVTFSNTTINYVNNGVAEERGEIYIGSSGSTINGTTNGSITLQNDNSVTIGSDFNPGEPVKVYIDGNRTPGSDMFLGTTDLSKFDLQNDKVTLAVNNGNIVAGSSSAIDGIAVDEENGEAVYYNLNGVAVNADELTPGLYIRRQGSKVTKIIVK